MFAFYGIIQFTIPYTTSFGVLLVQLSILGFFDGVFLTFIVPSAYDISKSSKLVNHATGFLILIFLTKNSLKTHEFMFSRVFLSFNQCSVRDWTSCSWENLWNHPEIWWSVYFWRFNLFNRCNDFDSFYSCLGSHSRGTSLCKHCILMFYFKLDFKNCRKWLWNEWE